MSKRDTTFTLQVDWYGTPEVQLQDSNGIKTLRKFSEVGDAVAWAGKWMRDRGFNPFCCFGYHEYMNHRHLTIYAGIPEVNPHPVWSYDPEHPEYDPDAR